MEIPPYMSNIFMVADIINKKAMPSTIYFDTEEGMVYVTVTVTLMTTTVAIGRTAPFYLPATTYVRRQYLLYGHVSTEVTWPTDLSLKNILKDIFTLI